MKLNQLVAIAALMAGTSNRFPCFDLPDTSVKQRTTRRSPAEQREAYQAAEDKRARRRSRNLANAKQAQGDLL